MKLNQVVAVEKSTKNQTGQEIVKLEAEVRKAELTTGFNRTYQPSVEGGEVFPPEQKKVTVRAQETLLALRKTWTKLMDVTATKDLSNTGAAADVVVDGKVVLEKVPITTLLFLEKQLVALRAFTNALPTLDPADEWVWNDGQNLYATAAVQTVKTKKVEKIVVKYEATKEHPAQTEIRPEDVTIGHWSTIKYSGALPATKVKDMLAKVEALQEAVKVAREEANNIQARDAKMGAAVFDFVFGS